MSVVPRENSVTLTYAEADRIFNRAGSGSYFSASNDARSSSMPPAVPTGETGGGVIAPKITEPPGTLTPQDSGVNTPHSNSLEGVGRPGGISAATQARLMGGGFKRSSSDNLDRPIDQPAGRQGGSVVPAEQLTRQDVLRNMEGGNVTLVAPEIAEEHQDYAGPEYHYTNWWFKFREPLKPYFAEFVGTLILILWGEGCQAQVLAARAEPSDYLSIAWGWGVGFMLAVYVSSGISGGHINPAVTISLAVFRKFPKRKVPGYILAQLLGAFAGAGILFGVYKGTLATLPDYNISVGKVFTTGPAAKVPSTSETFFSVYIGAALLLLAIASFTDTGNNPATPGLTPLLLGLIMVGIATAFGYQTGFVLNPARDLGPRLLIWAVTNIDSNTLWLTYDAYGIWVPTVGTITGGLSGMLFYDLLIYTGRDSPVNRNFSRRYRKAKKLYRKHQRDEEAALGHRTSGVSETRTLTGSPPASKTKFGGGEKQA